MKVRLSLAALAASAALQAPLALAARRPSSISPEYQPICRYDAPLCAEYQRLSDKLDSLSSVRIALGGSRTQADAETLAALQKDYAALLEKAQELIIRKIVSSAEKEPVLFDPAVLLKRRLASACLSVVPLRLSEISDALVDQEMRLSEIEKAANKYGRYLPDSTRKELLEKLLGVNADGTRLWKHLQTASLDLDHVGAPFVDPMPTEHFQSAQNLLSKANPLAGRIADLSRRLQALDRLLGGGLAPPEGALQADTKGVEKKVGGMLRDPFGGESTPGGESKNVRFRFNPAAKPAPADTLMGMRHVPSPQTPTQDGKHFRTGKISENSDRFELLTVTLMQALGLTEKLGDPDKRASFAFEQTGGTCGIACQVEVLEEAGLVQHTWKARKQKETELYEKAVAKGIFIGAVKEEPRRRDEGGLLPAYSGDLLGRPIRKHYAAKDDELEKVISQGRMVIVSVDAGILRNNPARLNRGHAIVVTGAERSRLSGTILGYYINDTGTGIGGRFVLIDQFHQAWHKEGSAFVEPL